MKKKLLLSALLALFSIGGNALAFGGASNLIQTRSAKSQKQTPAEKKAAAEKKAEAKKEAADKRAEAKKEAAEKRQQSKTVAKNTPKSGKKKHKKFLGIF